MKITANVAAAPEYNPNHVCLKPSTLVKRVEASYKNPDYTYYLVGATYITNLQNGNVFKRDDPYYDDYRFVIADHSITISN